MGFLDHLHEYTELRLTVGPNAPLPEQNIVYTNPISIEGICLTAVWKRVQNPVCDNFEFKLQVKY